MSVRVRRVPGISFCRVSGGRSRHLRAAIMTALSVFSLTGIAAAATKSVPGFIEAEDFDAGANGSAFYDTSPGNTGGLYRATDVDIEGCAEGGANIGWISAGEWLKYSVNVASAGTYTVELRVSSLAGGTFHVEFNGSNVTGAISVPATGGWQSWTTVRKTVTLGGGTQPMRVVFDTAGLNLNSINVTSGATAGGSSNTARSLPGWIEAEDFDNGANGSAYYDASSGNTGGAYRVTDVDIESSSDGGYNVGWISGGEWLNYTVNVATSGTYTIEMKVASPGGGSLHAEFNGSNKTGGISVPSTGDWQSWTTVRATASLSAGTQVMRVVFDTGGLNLNSINVSTSTSSAPAPAPSAPAPSSGSPSAF